MHPTALFAAAALMALATVASAQDQTPAQAGSPVTATAPLASTPPWPPGTRAPPNPANQAVAQACRADTQTLCSGVQPGGGRILQCFKEHAGDLSTGCKSALAQMRSASGGGGFRRRDGSVPN